MSLEKDKDTKVVLEVVVEDQDAKKGWVWPKAMIEFTCGKCGYVTKTLTARDCENCSHLVKKIEDFRSRIPTFFGNLSKKIGRATASSTTIRRERGRGHGHDHDRRRIHFDLHDLMDDDDDDYEDLSSNESSETLLAANNARVARVLEPHTGPSAASATDQGNSTAEGFDWEFPQPSERSINSSASRQGQGSGSGGPSSSFGRGRGRPRPRVLTPRPGTSTRNYRDTRIFSTDDDYEYFTPSEEELMRFLDVDVD